MSGANFKAALDFIWGADRDGHQDDTAPTETFRTSWGVTQPVWDTACAQGIVTGQLEDATQEQCAAIYRTLFWNALHCSSLPDGVDLVLFSNACLAGVGHEARLLQRIVHATVDGAIGPETLRKACGFGTKALIDALIAADQEYLISLANAPLFIHGWTRREEATRAAGYKVARIAA